jgi:nicotinamide mononucleotide transporter
MTSLNQALSFLGLSTTPLELISFILAFTTILLNIRQNHWAWLFSILSSFLYGFVFFDSKLYGDTGLQVMFVIISIWGWYQWLRGGLEHAPLRVTSLTFKWRMHAIGFWLLAFLLLSQFLWRFTDTDVPRMDGFLTAGSLIGQFLLSKKKIENWLVWIVVDLLYIGLYVHKDLYLTAFLYGLFTIMAIGGLLAWRKQAQQSH